MYRLLLATSGLVLFSLGAVRSGSAQGRLESVPLPAQPLVLHALASPAPGVVLGVSLLPPRQGYLYRWADGGWTEVAVDAAAGDQRLMGGMGRAYLQSGSHLFYTPDAGATWQARALPEGFALLDALRDTVVAGMDDRLALSRDGGLTWRIEALRRSVDGQEQPFRVRAAAYYHGAVVLTAWPVASSADAGLFRYDGLSPRPEKLAGAEAAGTLTRVEDALFSAAPAGVYRVTGSPWRVAPAMDGLPAPDLQQAPTVAADGEAAYLHVGLATFYRWTGGAWTALPPAPAPEHQAITVSGGNLITNAWAWNGTAWTPAPRPVVAPPLRVQAVGEAAVAEGATGAARRDPATAAWTPLALPPGHGLLTAPGLYARPDGPQAHLSDDDGATWRAVDLRDGGLAWMPDLAPRQVALLALPEGAALYAAYGARNGRTHVETTATYGVVRRSTDGGRTWTRLDAGLPAGLQGRAPVENLLAIGADLIARSAVADGFACRWLGGNSVWQPTACPPGLWVGVEGVAHRGGWYVKNASGLYATHDDGATWQSAAEGLPGGLDWAEAHLTSTPAGPVLLATRPGEGGAALYRMDGERWRPAAPTLPPGRRWTGLAATPTRLVVAGEGAAWTLPLAEVTGRAPLPPPPAALLALAGPNPVQGRAAISVGGREPVQIALFDALGRCVQRRDVMPGRVEISVAGLAPGYYVLRAEGSPATLLLTVLR